MTQELSSQNRKGDMQIWAEHDHWFAQIED
jgi:hypothetical protein